MVLERLCSTSIKQINAERLRPKSDLFLPLLGEKSRRMLVDLLHFTCQPVTAFPQRNGNNTYVLSSFQWYQRKQKEKQL